MTVTESKSETQVKGLNTFKMLLLPFIALTAVSIALYLFDPLVSVLAYSVGALCFIVGIYLVSKNNQQSGHGLKLFLLFLFAILFDLIVGVLTTLNPFSLNVASSYQAIASQLGTINHDFGFNVYPIAGMVLFSGIFMVLGGLSFSDWASDTINLHEDFKTFSYFGWIFLVGEIIIFSGYTVYVAALNEIIAGVHGTNTEAISFALNIVYVGVFFLLVSMVVEAVAGFQLFKHLNKASTS